MPKLALSLSELMAIEDVLGLETMNGDATDHVTGQVDDGPQFRNLALKIGSGLVECVKTQTDVELVFDADELWLLREHLSIQATNGNDMEFGLRLKCKVYDALLALANGGGTAADHADPADPEYDLGKLERWMEGSGNADSHGPTNTN